MRSRPTGASSIAVQIDPVRVLRQSATKLVASVGAGLVLGTLAHFVLVFTYPLYSGKVVFELAPAPDEVGSVIVRDQRTEEAVERLGQTEASRIVSRELLERAMDDRDIEQTKWSDKYKEDGTFLIREAVDDLIEEVSAGHQRRTNFFTLSWSAHNSEDVPVVLNRIANTYIQTRKSEEDRKFEQNRRTFQKQLDDIDADLLALGRQLTTFVTENNLTSTSEDRNDLLLAVEDTARRINETKGFMSLSQSRKSQTEAKMEGRLEPTPDDIRTAEGDPQVQQANANLQDLRVGAESYRKRFGPEHTALRNLERQVRAAEIERDATLDQILRRNLNADYKTYSDQTESYAELLESFEGDLKRQEERLKQFTAAQQTVSELREKRERLLEARARQLVILGDLDQLKLREDARSVSVAALAQTPREMSFPRLSVMIPLGAILSLGAMLAFVFVREILDTRVRYATDLMAIPGLRVLGSVPDLTEDSLGPKRIERVVSESPKSVAAETCRQIAGQIGKLCDQNGVRSIVCMSGLPEAGTTSVVTNLADSFAAGGKKVVVVDANFRRSRLASAMGTGPDAKGLGDVLKGVASTTEALHAAGGGVDIVPAGTVENRVFELLTTARMDALLAELTAKYDLVLVDVPPAVVAGDGLAIANKVDGVVLVVRAFQEQRGLVNRLVGQLHDVRGQIVGAVLNRPKLTAGGYLRKNYEAMAAYGEKS